MTDVGPYLRELERRSDLLRHTFDGWSIWPLFRMAAARALTQSDSVVHAVAPPARLFRASRLVASDAWALLRARRPVDAAVMTCSSYRSEREHGRWKDVMFDDFAGRLPRVFRVERINNPAMFARNEPANRADMTRTLFERLERKILARLPPPRGVVAVAGALAKDLQREPALAHLDERVLARRLSLFHHASRLWERFFRRLRARAVFCDDGYFQHDMIAGARRAGSVVCEFQHGVFFEECPEYAWPAEAIPYRDRMPIPDRFFLYGRVWAHLLDADGFWQGRTRVVGSARIDAHRARSGADRPAADPDECLLLVTTQGHSRERLASFLAELLRLACDWSGLRVVVKLHPSYDADPGVYQRTLGGDPRARILTAEEGPSTFELLERSRFHASISSACHYDALGLGTRTIIIAMPTHEMLLPLHRRGHALLASTPGEMLALMRRYRAEPPPLDMAHAYFEPGAITAFEREFAQLPPSPWS